MNTNTNKKLTLAACAVAVAMLLAMTGAEAITITFTENGRNLAVPPAPWQYTPGPAEFGPDILVTSVYQYADFGDPFDGVGISALPLGDPGATGIIDFVVPTYAVTVDWWAPYDTLYVEAYDDGGFLVDSFTGPSSSSGTDTLDGGLISSIEFHDYGGSVAISTLTFQPIPEPATMLMLGGLSAGLAGARKLRKKK